MPRHPPNPSALALAPETPRPRPHGLAEVAALAGVSTGTVSRALHHPDMISQATRQRVLEVAAQLGYVANGAARALALRKTQTVGAVVPRFGGSSFPLLVQSLEATLAEQGYNLLLSAPDHARAQDPVFVRTLLERGVDAVALLGGEQPPAVYRMLQTHRVPFVLMWATPGAPGPSVGFDEADAARLVVAHLAQLGHRRVAFVGGRSQGNERARQRLAGLRHALARHRMALPPEGLIETDYGFREGAEAMAQLLQRRLDCTAVVCGNDYLAAGVLSALDQAGIAVPADMSVASFNDNDFAAYLHPPLTTVKVPIAAMGEQAARQLLAQLAGQSPPPSDPLPLSLVTRRSTAAPPRA